jgi:hypothetical protein
MYFANTIPAVILIINEITTEPTNLIAWFFELAAIFVCLLILISASKQKQTEFSRVMLPFVDFMI